MSFKIILVALTLDLIFVFLFVCFSGPNLNVSNAYVKKSTYPYILSTV